MDELGKILKATGYRIAEVGCSGEPAVVRLAAAAGGFAPAAAETLGSIDQPEVARCRAFAHVARAAEALSPAERQLLANDLDRSADTTDNTEPALDRASERDGESAEVAAATSVRPTVKS